MSKHIELGRGRVAMQIAKGQDGDIGILFKEFDHSHDVGSQLGEYEDEVKSDPDLFMSFKSIESAITFQTLLTYAMALMSGVSKTDWITHDDFEKRNGNA